MLQSKVPGHFGSCAPTWLNQNALYNRLDRGVTGFFRLAWKFWIFTIKHGPEFHGIIQDGVVYSTARGDQIA